MSVGRRTGLDGFGNVSQRFAVCRRHRLLACSLITLRAKLSGAVYCNRSCLWVCLSVCVCRSATTITRNCVHQTGFIGKGSDHLQLIKFWPSCAPGKGVCGGAKIFGSALLQPARSVCVSLSAFLYSILAATATASGSSSYRKLGPYSPLLRPSSPQQAIRQPENFSAVNKVRSFQ